MPHPYPRNSHHRCQKMMPRVYYSQLQKGHSRKEESKQYPRKNAIYLKRHLNPSMPIYRKGVSPIPRCSTNCQLKCKQPYNSTTQTGTRSPVPLSEVTTDSFNIRRMALPILQRYQWQQPSGNDADHQLRSHRNLISKNARQATTRRVY